MRNNILNCFDPGPKVSLKVSFHPLRRNRPVPRRNGTGISRKNFSLECKFIRLTLTPPVRRSASYISRYKSGSRT